MKKELTPVITTNPTPKDKQKTKLYTMTLQGKLTNAVAQVTQKKLEILDDGQAVLATNEGIVTISDFLPLQQTQAIGKIGVHTHQLFLAIVQEYTRTGNKEVILSYKDYMKMRGLKTTYKAGLQVASDIVILRHLGYDFIEEATAGIQAGGQNYFQRTTFSSKTGEIYCLLSDPFTEYLSYCGFAQIPNLLYSIDERKTPHSFYFGLKLANHKHMNKGKPNENIISVTSLLKSSPIMPTRKEVLTEKKGKIRERIIEPFERDMDALKNILEWEYCNAKQQPLTYEQVTNQTKYFFSFYVKITWYEHPEDNKEKKLPSVEVKKKQFSQ